MITLDLSGKRALVTAGAGGIGRSIAVAMIDAGARVAVCDVDGVALDAFASDHPSSIAIAADVSDAADVDALFERIEQEWGGLDILVNNAGISGPTGPIESIAPDDWDRTLSVNVKGAFLCARRAAPWLKAQGNGAIINLSSTAGRIGMPLRAPYSTSKYAIRGLNDTLAIELGEHGVRVNAILAGLVDGDRGRRVIGEQADAHGMTYDAYLPRFLHNIALHAAVEADDVAALAVFLASDHARYISGQSIGVCGGFETYRAPMIVAA